MPGHNSRTPSHGEATNRLAAAGIVTAFAIPILLATIWAFGPGLDNQFLNWDDDRNFLENPAYRGLGADEVRWVWQTYHMGVWQPLAWFLLSAQYVVGGLSPRVYHQVSLFLHALNAVVFFLVTAQILRAARGTSPHPSSTAAYLGAAVAALLFAVHPLRVEAVTWISAQPYLPAVLFFTLAVSAYVRAHRAAPPGKTGRRWLAVSLACYLLAVGFKAVAVTLPAVLLILDVYPLRRWRGVGHGFAGRTLRLIAEKTPFFVVALFVSIWAAQAKDYNETRVPFHESQPNARLAQSAYGFAFYPLKTVAPTGLIPFYKLPHDLGLARWPYAPAAISVAVLTLVLFLTRRRWPAPFAAWIVYGVILFPNVGLLQISQQIAADRYSYLAIMPLMILLAGGLSALWSAASAKGPAIRAAILILSAAAAISLGIGSNRQVRIWHDSQSLWSATLRIDPRCAVAECQLGQAFVEAQEFENGITHFETAIRLEPDFAFAYTNLGAIHLHQGDLSTALRMYQRALASPYLRETVLAKTHAGIGAVYAGLGQYDLAWKHTRLARRLGFPVERLQPMIDALRKVSTEPEN